MPPPASRRLFLQRIYSQAGLPGSRGSRAAALCFCRESAGILPPFRGWATGEMEGYYCGMAMA
jgi:hypothetical protein